MIRHTLLLAFVLLLVGCDATAPGPASPLAFELGGALQAAFLDEVTEAEAMVQTTPDGAQTFVLRLYADQERDGQERAELTVRVPLGGDLAPGHYAFDEDAQVTLSYLLDRSPELLAQYRFEGHSLVLDVVRVSEGEVAGEVRAMVDQTFGERTLHGQRETVVLAGPVTASATFTASFRAR